MRSVVYTAHGSPSVLKVVERPVPEPGPGEIRVRIEVSGMNPTDVGARQGSGALPHPQVPGQDGAGVVDAVGPSVTRLTLGDRVWVWDAAWERAEGTTQEFVVLPERQVVALPDSVSFEVGASLGIPALTAHRLLTSFGGGPDQLAPGALEGSTVLVQGGAGDVGHAVIQFAAWASATVIATVRGDAQRARAAAAGAHHIIDFSTEDVASAVLTIVPDGVDIVTEVAAGENLATDLEVIRPSGGIAIYTPGHGPLPVPGRDAMTKNAQLSFVLTYTTTTEQKDAAVAAVSSLLTDGGFAIGSDAGLPVTVFSFDDAAAAHQAVEDHTPGKVLIRVATSDRPTA